MPVVLDSGNQLEAFLARWMQQKAQEKQHKETLAQNQSQFEASHANDTARTGAFVGQANAAADKSRYDVSADRGKTIALSLKQNFDKLVEAGQIEQAQQYAAGVAKQYANDMEVQAAIIGMTTARPRTALDDEAANKARFAADQTGLAAGGSQDVQARAFTQESILGKPMSAHQFGDQSQRQGGDAAYGKFLRREGGDLPTAGQELQARTQKDIAGMQIASQQHDLNIGTYAPLTDQYGTVVGFFNAKTGDFKRPPIEGARKSGLAAGEREMAATAEGMVQDVARARELAEAQRGSIGPVEGRVGKVTAAVTDVAPELNELQQIVGSLKNRILYLKSGKQINESEYKRLAATLPDVTQPESKFFENLRRLEVELNQVVARNTALGSPRPRTGATGEWSSAQGDGVIRYDESGKRIQ